MRNILKKALAFMLAAALLIGCVVLRDPARVISRLAANQANEDAADFDRPAFEEMAKTLFGADTDVSDVSDEALETLVMQALSVENDGAEKKKTAIVTPETEKYYNEKNEITAPFDTVRPDLIESGEVAFAADSLLVKAKKNAIGQASLSELSAVEAQPLFSLGNDYGMS